MRHWSNARQTVACSKTLLLTLVGETDAWIDAAQSSYNVALSANDLTAAQKTLLFCAVALMRIDPGIAALLRGALGVEVD